MKKYLGSFIRHALTLFGGAMFVQRNESAIETAVAVLMAAIGAGWSAYNAHSEMESKPSN